MVQPPKKLADQTVKAYAKCRDAELYHLPAAKQADLFNKAQELFRKLTTAMKCEPQESWMVSENIARMIKNIAPSKRAPR
jgi:hypothetical protein